MTTNGSSGFSSLCSPIVNSANSEPPMRNSKSFSKAHLHTNARSLVDSEIDSLNPLFSFTLEACYDPKGSNRHDVITFNSEKDSFLSHDKAGQFVYCSPSWSLAVQCVENIRTCHAKSPMNTRAVIVLSVWPQFNATTTKLRLLRQDPTDIPVFTKPSPLGKRHTFLKVRWPINYWVINKDTHVNVCQLM